jgi:hypothetical protein
VKPGDISSESVGPMEVRVGLGHKEQFPHAELVKVTKHCIVLRQKEGKVPILGEFKSDAQIHFAYAHNIGNLEDLIRAKVAIDQAIENVLWADMKKKESK